jgi:predicted RNase H-like nuclease
MMVPSRTMWVAGADGCKAGWICASRDTPSGEPRFDLVTTISALLELKPRPRVLCIDIPIGLPDQLDRACDRQARTLLGWPREASVFPAPLRASLRALDREEASRITERIDGRQVGTQAWALYPKILEVDNLLAANPEARTRSREVHPEVSFWAWNGNRPMQASKKTAFGKRQRLRLVEEWLGAGVLSSARAKYPKKTDVADDDFLDAIAALWTATRVAAGSAQILPTVAPSVDAAGLQMEIVY